MENNNINNNNNNTHRRIRWPPGRTRSRRRQERESEEGRPLWERELEEKREIKDHLEKICSICSYKQPGDSAHHHHLYNRDIPLFRNGRRLLPSINEFYVPYLPHLSACCFTTTVFLPYWTDSEYDGLANRQRTYYQHYSHYTLPTVSYRIHLAYSSTVPVTAHLCFGRSLLTLASFCIRFERWLRDVKNIIVSHVTRFLWNPSTVQNVPYSSSSLPYSSTANPIDWRIAHELANTEETH